MQDIVLEQLKKKYEYLDFNNAKVLECFHNAVGDLRKDNPAAFENKVLIGLELEHYFLYYLVLEMQKGNREIYDAVSIAFEKTNEFFVRKRKDLTDIFDKRRQKVFYDEAFRITIDCYYRRMSFNSKLIENLIDVYKNGMFGYREVESMSYNIHEKSLYKVFGNYSEKLSYIIFKAFKKREDYSYSFLVKKYGIDLDGKKSGGIISYIDSTRIQGIISRLNSWFEYGQYMLKKGESLEAIYDFFVKTSEEKLLQTISSYQNSNKNVKETLLSKDEILKKYNLSEKMLGSSIDYVKNKDLRIAYKYTYGLGVKSRSSAEVIDMLDVTKEEYQQGLLSVQRDLPNLIKKAEEVQKMLDGIYHQGLEEKSPKPTKPTKPQAFFTKPSSVVNDVPPPDNNPKDSEKEITPKQNQTYPYFCDRLYPADIKEEEKADFDLKAYEVFNSITSYEKGKELAQKMYGEDLKQIAQKVSMTPKERSAFNNLIAKMRHLLSNPEKKLSGRRRNQYFIEYFYVEGMSEEEKEKLQSEFISIVSILKEKSPQAFALTQKLYGENLDQELSDYHVSKEESTIFTAFVISAKRVLNAEKRSKNAKKYQLNNNFAEYFYKEGMSEEEKNSVLEKLKKALLFSQGTKPYQLLYEIYDENLNLIKGVEVNRNQNQTIVRFIKTLSTTMTLDLDALLKKTQKGRKREDFFEYFMDSNMTDEQKQALKSELILIIEYIKDCYVKGYEVAVLLYGNDLSEKRKNIKITDQQKSNFNNFIARAKNLIGKELPKKNIGYITYPKRPEKFSMYFYKLDMKEQERLEQDKKVSEIILQLQNCKLKGYGIAKKLYGENLDQELKSLKTDANEKNQFRVFVEKIKSILDEPQKDVEISGLKLNKRKDTFFEYFYKEGITDEQKEEINNKVLEFFKIYSLSGIDVAYKLYGPGLDKLSDTKLTANENSNLSWLRREIRLYLETGNVTKEKRGRKCTAYNSFFEYFYQEGMTSEQKEEVNKKVSIFVHSCNLAGRDVAYKLCGEDLNSFHEELELTRLEKVNLTWLRREIREYLNGNERKVRNRREESNSKTFFENFYQEGMTEEEKTLLDQTILEIIEQKKETEGYVGAQAMYGDDFKSLQTTYSRKSYTNCRELLKFVEEELKHLDRGQGEKLSFPNIPPVEEPFIEEIVGEIEEIPFEEILDEKLETDEEVSYIDSLLLKLHDDFYTHEQIQDVLSISSEELMNRYIHNLGLLSDVDAVLDYIVRNYPNKIKDVLESSYFKTFMEELTKKEQEVVYLKLLSKSNDSLTDEVIATLTDLPVEEISNYQIMTKDDSLNSLNEYIKKPILTSKAKDQNQN